MNTATNDDLDAVDIPPSSTIQLLTADADLPFSVRNDLPWPVNVELSVAPTDPRLEVEPVTAATMQPNTSGRVKVPVSARVGSGEVGADVSSCPAPPGCRSATRERARLGARRVGEASVSPSSAA